MSRQAQSPAAKARDEMNQALGHVRNAYEWLRAAQQCVLSARGTEGLANDQVDNASEALEQVEVALQRVELARDRLLCAGLGS